MANALINTTKILSNSTSGHAKEKYGFYLVSTGVGIKYVLYYFYFRKIDAQYLACKTSQTLIGYSYAVNTYDQEYDLKKLGNLVESMDL